MASTDTSSTVRAMRSTETRTERGALHEATSNAGGIRARKPRGRRLFDGGATPEHRFLLPRCAPLHILPGHAKCKLERRPFALDTGNARRAAD